jgi:hypothetical protein
MTDAPIPVMLRVAGKRFACDRCGATVFTPAGENYVCNGCGTMYGSGETAVTETSGTPVSVWQGEMTLLGVVLHLHVLDDGTRIIEAQDMAALLEAMERGGRADEDEMATFARWLRGEAQ